MFDNDKYAPIDCATFATIDFLRELMADETAQKIFIKFSEAKIVIIIGDRYAIFGDGIMINARDGVKKAAEWLEKGKIK